MLSQNTFELLNRPDRIGVAVVGKLLSIDLRIAAANLAPVCINACCISYLAAIPVRIYHDLLAIENQLPGFSRSEIVDELVNGSSLIAGKSLDMILASDKNGDSYRWQESYQLSFGSLVKRQRGKNYYWYWQYYRSDGSRADSYMHKTLDGAISRVRSIGIPDDAKPQRLNKSKKTWIIN